MARNVFSFSSGYRIFSSYWWQYYFRLRTYTKPFKYGYQRMTRGWADCDTWNLDDHLADILPEMLKHLRDNTNGYPSELMRENDPEGSLGFADWKSILTLMALGFEAAGKAKETPEEFITELTTSTGISAQLGLNDRQYDWPSIGKYQAEQMKTFRKGMKLFTKHFFSLWD